MHQEMHFALLHKSLNHVFIVLTDNMHSFPLKAKHHSLFIVTGAKMPCL